MYRKILMPADSSGVPGAVVEHILTLARADGATVLALRVIPIIPVDEVFFRQIQFEEGSRGAKFRDKALAYFEELSARFASEGIPFSFEVIVTERTEAEAIVRYANESACDLIVMPIQRQSAFGRWLAGNVADKVRDRSEVPVLFVPTAGP